MKVVGGLFLGLFLSFNLLAADLQTVNQESVEVFLELFPRYKTLAESYGQGVDSISPSMAGQHIEKMEELLSQFDISMEDFSVLSQKISMGFIAVQSGDSGIPSMFGNIAEQMGIELSSTELDIIQKYFSQIKEILTY